MTAVDISSLQTEERNPRTADIDSLPTTEVVSRMHHEDIIAAQAVEPCIPVISQAIDSISPKVRRGGRVIYMGAGTSGRLGVLDASEIPPTYSAPSTQFVGLIAGGDYAIRNPIEGAEDIPEKGKEALEELCLDPELDTVIGIASSGRTPYVLGGLAYAKSVGCVTGGIACASPSEMETSGNVDYMITPITGPEVVTGSTRMKAGTATKMVLNMISTGVMIRIGKTCGNLMVDVKVSNLKLRARSRRILRTICGDTFYVVKDDKTVSSSPQPVPNDPTGDHIIDRTIAACGESVKLAIVVSKSGLTPAEAKLELETADGVLDRVLKQHAKV